MCAPLVSSALFCSNILYVHKVGQQIAGGNLLLAAVKENVHAGAQSGF